jgi:hypothetical protein
MREKFEEEADKVKYTRTIELPDNKEATVEIYLTKNYLTDIDEPALKTYLNQAVAAVLTREGVPDADL